MLPLNYALISIVTDYEQALKNAINQVFPESTLSGCLFHFNQVTILFLKANEVMNNTSIFLLSKGSCSLLSPKDEQCVGFGQKQ